jgi:hypothetical protein
MRGNLLRVYDAYVTKRAGELLRPPEKAVKAEPNLVSYYERSAFMSDVLREEPVLDVDTLRQAIQEEYAEVASHPEKGFHFHTGRPLARLLEYADDWLEGIPESSIESFAGTGNPFSLGELGLRAWSSVRATPRPCRWMMAGRTW